MRVSKVLDGTDPGATPGQTFTASLGVTRIEPEGENLNYLSIGLKGAVSTAAVAIEDFAGLLSEYVLRVGAENRIVLRGDDMVALMAAYYGERPTIGENTDNTGNDFIGGLKVPVYATVEASKPITHAATRTAVTNIGTETISVSAYWDKDGNGHKPIHAVVIALTTAGAAGYMELTSRIAPVGTLRGILLKNVAASDFTDANIDVSVQRLRIKANGQVHSQFNTLGDAKALGDVDFVTPTPYADLVRSYKYFDCGPTGIDAKGQELTIEMDIQDVSDAIRIIPIIEIA